MPIKRKAAGTESVPAAVSRKRVRQQSKTHKEATEIRAYFSHPCTKRIDLGQATALDGAQKPNGLKKKQNPNPKFTNLCFPLAFHSVRRPPMN